MKVFFSFLVVLLSLSTSQGQQYPVIQSGATINNSPWYGLGISNFTFTGSSSKSVQLAGHYGLYLKTKYGEVAVHENGNVGIGTAAPISKFNVVSSGDISRYPTANSLGDVVQFIESSNNALEIGNALTSNSRKTWILARHSKTAVYGKFYSVLHIQPNIGGKSNYKGVAIGYGASEDLPKGTHLAINGNVGIGTASPDAKLTVKGNIHAKEVKVDLVGWPDYVFTEDYTLPTLKEVEEHIKEKGHLINIPSAEEIEANGLELGHMNKLLLEKIEELTLHLIRQQNQIDNINKKCLNDTNEKE